MLGVFSEFEREIIRERVNSGLARAKAQGKKLGRPRRIVWPDGRREIEGVTPKSLPAPELDSHERETDD